MATDILDELLKLPPGERAELAMALWESLDDTDREGAIVLTADQEAELDRRWAAIQANPYTALSRDELVQRVNERRGTRHPV